MSGSDGSPSGTPSLTEFARAMRRLVAEAMRLVQEQSYSYAGGYADLKEDIKCFAVRSGLPYNADIVHVAADRALRNRPLTRRPDSSAPGTHAVIPNADEPSLESASGAKSNGGWVRAAMKHPQLRACVEELAASHTIPGAPAGNGQGRQPSERRQR